MLAEPGGHTPCLFMYACICVMDSVHGVPSLLHRKASAPQLSVENSTPLVCRREILRHRSDDAEAHTSRWSYQEKLHTEFTDGRR